MCSLLQLYPGMCWDINIEFPFKITCVVWVVPMEQFDYEWVCLMGNEVQISSVMCHKCKKEEDLAIPLGCKY